VTRAVLADSGPLYAAVDPDDGRHDGAQRELAELTRDAVTVSVPLPVVCEAHALVMRRLRTATATDFLTELLLGALVAHPTGDDCVEGFARVAAFPDQRITVFDAITAAMSDRLSRPVWTYDRHFDAVGAEVWR
jgi:predicted nucleic acid-binding protein